MNKQILIDALPALPVKRYTPDRKARILDAIAGAAITENEACERYSISKEELRIWQRNDSRFGISGLRVTKIQHYADLREAHALA